MQGMHRPGFIDVENSHRAVGGEEVEDGCAGGAGGVILLDFRMWGDS